MMCGPVLIQWLAAVGFAAYGSVLLASVPPASMYINPTCPFAQRTHPTFRIGDHDRGVLGDFLGGRLHGARDQLLIRRGRLGTFGGRIVVHCRRAFGRRAGGSRKSAQTEKYGTGAEHMNGFV